MDKKASSREQERTPSDSCPPSLPLSTVVYTWGSERGVCATEMLREMQRHIYTAGGKTDEENFLAPVEDFESGKILQVWPRKCFSRSGEMTAHSLKAAHQPVVHPGGREGLAYGTDSFWRAWWFLKEPVPDTEPLQMREMLDEFMVKREDFKKWVEFHRQHRLPHFWFPRDRPSPEKIIEYSRRLGKTGSKKSVLMEIVAEIDAVWTPPDRLTNIEIGRLFPKQTNETDDALEQRGKRLRGKMT